MIRRSRYQRESNSTEHLYSVRTTVYPRGSIATRAIGLSVGPTEREKEASTRVRTPSTPGLRSGRCRFTLRCRRDQQIELRLRLAALVAVDLDDAVLGVV